MERDFEDSKMTQRNTEKTVLCIFSLYSLCMIAVAVYSRWGNGVPFFMVTQIVSCWIIYAAEYKTYRFRAVFTAVAMLLGYIQYAVNLRDVFPTTAVLVTLTLLLGLYGVKEVIYVTFIASLFVFFYHGVILETIYFHTLEQGVQIVLWVGNVFVGQYLVYCFIRRKNDCRTKLMELNQTLKETERSKNDFLANVSHEVRTPINTICGMSEVALRETDVQRMKEDICGIRMAGRTLMSVVSDILDFSELQSGKVEIEEEAYSITSMVNDIINMTMAKKNEKDIEVIVGCDASMPCVLLGDEKKIRRVIMNLVNNAVKFTSEGCVSIILETRPEEYGVNLVVTVKDTGIGMKEESVEKLFTSFNQVDTRRNRTEDGLGLGLAITRIILQKMGGVITVKSRYGKGSVIKAVIPQKVIDDKPIAELKHKEDVNVAVYIDMEQFHMTEIRDEYSSNILHMARQLQARCCVCRNLPELKRRAAREDFSHIFISIVEYREDQPYFDALAKRLKLVVVLDRPDDKKITNPAILRIYKPFYILPVVSVLNGRTEEEKQRHMIRSGRFTAPNAHILVVDDNIMNIRVIEGILEDYKIQVTMAASGREALEKIETMDYDFVFMDHMMPEMDGVETMHRIREKVGTYYQKVPVVALTANAVAGTREMFIKEGFADFLEKPIEVSVLERVLKRNLPEEKLIFEEEAEGKKASGPQQDAGDEALVIGDLDVKTGAMYCGGIDKYMRILRMHSEKGGEGRENLQKLYERADWENYTIAVHGVKSFMKSIGALKLSQMAKKLEAAGKQGDIGYILKNHAPMLEEYLRVDHMLKAYRDGGRKPGTENAFVKEQEARDIPELTDIEFETGLAEFEASMYELDGDRMLELITEWQKCSYCGASLKELLLPVRRKVEMSDYMSAVDAARRLGQKLKNGEEGE